MTRPCAASSSRLSGAICPLDRKRMPDGNGGLHDSPLNRLEPCSGTSCAFADATLARIFLSGNRHGGRRGRHHLVVEQDGVLRWQVDTLPVFSDRPSSRTGCGVPADGKGSPPRPERVAALPLQAGGDYGCFQIMVDFCNEPGVEAQHRVQDGTRAACGEETQRLLRPRYGPRRAGRPAGLEAAAAYLGR